MLKAKYILDTHGGVCTPFLMKKEKKYIIFFCKAYNYKMKMIKGVAYVIYNLDKYLNQKLPLYEFTGADSYCRGYVYNHIFKY